jgi:hypothetical protein
MYSASLLMSWVSIVIMGPAGLFMYESSGSISRTSPILLPNDSESFCVSELFMKIWELDFNYV